MIDLLAISLLQALAGQPAPAPPPQMTHLELGQAIAVDPMDVVRCRLVEAPESRVRRQRLCSTPRQDEAARREVRQFIDDRQVRSLTSGIGGR